MSIQYKENILQKLKEAGYNTNRLRKEKVMGEATIQKLRQGELVSWATINTICALLQCQISDVVEFIPEAED